MGGAHRPVKPRAGRIALVLLLVLVVALLAGCVRTGNLSTLPATTPLAVATWGVTSSPAPTTDEPTATARPAPTAQPTSTPRSSPTASPAPTPPPSPTVDDRVALAARIDALVAATPANVGAVVALPDGTTLYERQPDRVYEAASLYKLGILAEVYRQREAGLLSFDDQVTLYSGFFFEGDDVYTYANDAGTAAPIGELLRAMITVSSNVAAYALLWVVGTDNVNATLRSLGLTSTEIHWYPWTGRSNRPDLAMLTPGGSTRSAKSVAATTGAAIPDGGDAVRAVPGLPDAYNVTSPADMARFFELLLAGKVVSPGASQEMLDLLSDQQINNRLPADLPFGTRVAHKTGDLDFSVHDAGVIYAPRGPIVVAVLGDEVQNQAAVVDFIRRIGRLAFEAQS